MPAYRDMHDLSGMDFGGNPSSPSKFVRKRSKGKDEGQIDENKLNQMVLGQMAVEGLQNAENGPGDVSIGLPASEQANLIGDTERTGESDQVGPVAGMKGTVPEKKRIDNRLLKLIASRYQ